jgi:hypothetical protein
MPKGYRSVHIDGQEWLYKIGHTMLVVKNPDGQRKAFGLNAIPEYNEHDWDKRNCQLLPSHIKAFVESVKGEWET